MSSLSKQSCAWLRGTGILTLLCLGSGMAQAAPPAWWSTGTPPVINGNAANNKGPATIGQAKWVAKNALAAIQTQDAALAALIEADLVGAGKPLASWATPTTPEQIEAQKAPLLVGQLKAIAAPFYDRLNARLPAWLAAERAANGTEMNDGIYPWTDWAADDTNGGIAVLGQLKACFALHFTDDLDADGVSDFKEWLKYGNTSSSDYDGDGVDNLDEIAQGTNPEDAVVAMTGGLPNDWLTFNAGKTAVYPPVARITLQPGQTGAVPLIIRNVGNYMTYSVTVTDNTKDAYSVSPYSVGHTTSIAGVGGFGTLLNISNQTNSSQLANFATGFTFPFYGTNYSSVYVGTNGVLSFGTGVDSGVNTDLPNTSLPAMIAPFWDALNPIRGVGLGNIYVLAGPTSMTIEWDRVLPADTDLTLSYKFQVKLFADGRIQCYYISIPAGVGYGTEGTIGIQNAGGTSFLKVVKDGVPASGIPDGAKMLEFSPKSAFFTVDPDSGSISANQKETIQGNFNAFIPPAPSTFPDGTYTANLHFDFGTFRPAVDTKAILTVASAAATVGPVTVSKPFILPGEAEVVGVTAKHSLGVKSVEFFDGATSLGAVPGIPGTANNTYAVNYPAVGRGHHQLKAKVTNTTDGVTWSAATVLTVQDDDGDGVSDEWERTYLGTTSHDYTGADATLDSDGDGLTDLREYQLGTRPDLLDTDGDGLPDGYEVANGSNPLVSDHYDSDGDGIPDSVEIANGLNPNDPSDAWLDKDGDGTLNFIEFVFGTNINSPVNSPTPVLTNAVLDADPDGDGLTTRQEIALHLNPLEPDTDGDGLSDGWEVKYASRGFDPHVSNLNNPNPLLRPGGDLDGDGLSNLEEDQLGTDPGNVDTDGDGFSDMAEYLGGSNPLGAGSTPSNPGGIPGGPTGPLPPIIPVQINFGDHSDSHSEKYKISLEPLEGDAYTATRYHSNHDYGVTQIETFMVPAGAKYKVTLTHLSTDEKYSSDPKHKDDPDPDFDYTLQILPTTSTDPSVAVVYEDPDGILGVHNESDPFFAQGKSATLDIAWLTSQTVAQYPADRERLTLGVGEEVNLAVKPSTTTTINWTKTVGALQFTTGAANQLRLSDDTGAETVSATYLGNTLTKNYTIYEPSKVDHVAIQPDYYAAGQAGAGMAVSPVVMAPTNVSFLNVQLMEVGKSASSITGTYFSSPNPGFPAPSHSGHGADNWFPLDDHNRWSDQADYFPAAAPWSNGSFTWDIPAKWKVVAPTVASGEHPVPQGWNQVFTITASGTFSISKFTHTVTRTVAGVVTSN